MSTNRGILVVYIVETVYVLHHSKYIAICRIDVIDDDFDRFNLFFCCFFEIDNLPSPKFCFLTSSRKLVFAIHSRFSLILFTFYLHLNLLHFFLVFQLTVIIFGVKAWFFYYGKCSLAAWL